MNTSDISLVDTHAHLNMSEFDADREEVINRARAAGVGEIIVIGIDVPSSQQAIDIAEQNHGIMATVGIHPHEASLPTRADITRLARLAEHPAVVGIGEIGLDFYRDYSPRDRQLEVLDWQLDLAAELGLPVVIHCRETHEDMLCILRTWIARHAKRQPSGVIHCFMGDGKTARQYLEMGFYLSLGAYIGYPANTDLHEVIRNVPANRLMVETDCPFLAPQQYRGQRNEPAYVRHAAEELAKIRGVPFETIARETTQNARRLFRR